MKACYPYLKETKGSVINFASGAGLFGNYGQCAYAAAKEAIRGLTRVAASEWGAYGINANVILHGLHNLRNSRMLIRRLIKQMSKCRQPDITAM